MAVAVADDFLFIIFIVEEWRLIESGHCRASYNMALDEAIAAAVRKGTQPATLRLYGWEKTSLSLGCFQDASGIDLSYCSARDIPIVRRPTGGRAVLHDRELTYSFSTRTDRGPFSKGLLDSYRKIAGAFQCALEKSGIESEARKDRERGSVLTGSPLCFQSSSFGEILAGGRKLIGSAQKRWSDGLLQQGSIPYFHDLKETRRVFGINEPAELSGMTGIMEMSPDLKEKEIRGMIRRAFEETFDIILVQSDPSPWEKSLARELESEKYLQFRWNFCRQAKEKSSDSK